MSGYSEWRRLWDEVNAAMDQYGTAQARETSRFLKRIRKAVASYGWMVDPTSFDEFGEIIEPDVVDGVDGAHWKKSMADVLDDLAEVEE